MKRYVPNIIKRQLNVFRYVNLLHRASLSLRTRGVRKTGHLVVGKVLRKLGLANLVTSESRYLTENPTTEAITLQTTWSTAAGYRPIMRLALPLSGRKAKAVRDTVQSLKWQTYPHWVLKVLCPSDASKKVKRMLQSLKRSDPRIQLIAIHSGRLPLESLNEALDPAEEGYFGCIQEGDELSHDALYRIAHDLAHDPELDVLYTDEAHIPVKGKHPEHGILKPNWSPEMLLGYYYLGSLCMVRQSLLIEVGGFRPEYQEAQEWDLALRLMDSRCQIQRIPHYCYLRRTDNGAVPQGTSTPNTAANYRKALKAHLHRQGLTADVETQTNGVQRIRWNLSEEPRVSIIIPNKNSPELIQTLVKDLRQNTDYHNTEIIIVDNGSTNRTVQEFYREQTSEGHLIVVPFDQEFNYSAACNAGAYVATGELLLFLNNDMEVQSPDWLTELVGWALLPETGVVGGKLFYPNGHLQHAGVVIGLHFVTHISHKAPNADWGVLGTVDTYRNYMAVTGACQMVSRELFEEIGGYDENYRLVGSDIALCLRAWQKGFRTAYTPFASLIHYEEYSRGRSVPTEDMERLALEIQDLKLYEDPYLHPNLHSEKVNPTLRGPDDIGPKEMLKRQLEHYNPPPSHFQTIDWFDDEAIRRGSTQSANPLGFPTYTPAKVADDVNEAAAFILYVLRKRKDIRKRFPLALSEGKDGAFCNWLCNEGLKEFRISSQSANRIRKAFVNHPGLRIRQLYGFRPDLRHIYPTAFLPTGQRPFLRWLLEKGRHEYQFRNEEIWWFFLETSEDPAREFEFTYNVQQEWQRNFPAAYTAFGRERILSWLKRRHCLDDRILENIQALTNPITVEEIRAAYWCFPFWQSKFPNAFREEAETRNLIDWLRAENENAPVPKTFSLSSENQFDHRQLGMNVLGHFCYPSGLQQSTRSLVRSLQMENIAVSVRDVPAHYQMDDPDRTGYLNLETYDVSLVHVQPVLNREQPYIASIYDSTGLEPRADVYRIGYWYWELEDVPWTWKRAVDSIQELWAPTAFVANAMKKTLSKKVTPMLPGVSIGEVEHVDRGDFGVADDEFFFLFMFDMKSIMERKNPLGLIEAYRKAFRRDDKAKLLIKVSSGYFNAEELTRLKQAAHDAGVLLVDEVLTRERSYGLIEACDCYVSLHRSEGLGLTMAEAMLMSKPVIATNYSGNVDFMNDSCSMLVDYQIRPLRGTCPDSVYYIYDENASWAHPSVEHAANWMRWAYENQDDAKAMGHLAKKHASSVLSPEATARRLRTRLEEIYHGIWTKQASETIAPAA